MSVRERAGMLCVAMIVVAAAASAQVESPDPAKALLRLANQDRAAHRLPPLRWDAALAQAARGHLNVMAGAQGELLHQYPGEENLQTRAAQAGAHFSTVSENLAAGGQDPARLEEKWMSTPVHRANLLSPELDVVGIAVLTKDGALYAVEDFGRAVAARRDDEIAKHVAEELKEHGIAPAESNADAQQTCGMAKGAAGSPKLVVQWDGADPEALPDALLQQLEGGRYTSGQVGVCPGQQGGAFTTYHVAVLLY